MYLPVALTIAGSDSGGGAGIQADIKTFYALGVHGASVITSVTSQNTLGVRARHDLPAGVVASQLEVVLEDLEVAAAKTGMLANAELVDVVAEAAARHEMARLVVDPVTVSSSGQLLLEEAGLEALIARLLPLAQVFTPNLPEASAILGWKVADREEMQKAARLLKELGPACVVVKGGHLEGGSQAVDVFFDGEQLVELAAPHLDVADSHGTGCVFSAAVTARLARGESPLQAVTGAKRDVNRALESALRLGGGSGPVHPRPDWKTMA